MGRGGRIYEYALDSFGEAWVATTLGQFSHILLGKTHAQHATRPCSATQEASNNAAFAEVHWPVSVCICGAWTAIHRYRVGLTAPHCSARVVRQWWRSQCWAEAK